MGQSWWKLHRPEGEFLKMEFPGVHVTAWSSWKMVFPRGKAFGSDPSDQGNFWIRGGRCSWRQSHFAVHLQVSCYKRALGLCFSVPHLWNRKKPSPECNLHVSGMITKQRAQNLDGISSGLALTRQPRDGWLKEQPENALCSAVNWAMSPLLLHPLAECWVWNTSCPGALCGGCVCANIGGFKTHPAREPPWWVCLCLCLCRLVSLKSILPGASLVGVFVFAFVCVWFFCLCLCFCLFVVCVCVFVHLCLYLCVCLFVLRHLAPFSWCEMSQDLQKKAGNQTCSLETIAPLNYFSYKLEWSGCKLQLVIFRLLLMAWWFKVPTLPAVFIPAIYFKFDQRLCNPPEFVLVLFRSWLGRLPVSQCSVQRGIWDKALPDSSLSPVAIFRGNLQRGQSKSSGAALATGRI